MSCTDGEWARIRAAAEAAGEPIGRHVVRRCLTDDTSPNARPRASHTLSPEEQRHMYELIGTFPLRKPEPGLPEHPELWIHRLGLQLLCAKRIEAMEREGRTEELQDTLRRSFGDEDGAKAAEAIRRSVRETFG